MTAILNDIHIGFNRVGGTTPASREALRNYLFTKVDYALASLATYHDHVIIAGDLFDDFEVPGRDWLQTFNMLVGWLNESGRRLTLAAGNHDANPRGDKVSSFQMLCEALIKIFPERFDYLPVGTLSLYDESIWLLAHYPNQDSFDEALESVLNADGGIEGHTVIVHANLDNNFAVESDHSLNVSADMALRFVKAGAHLMFAHEHQARTYIPHGTPADATGTVTVMGNQFPTSISDCLGNDEKYVWRVEEDGPKKEVTTWAKDGIYPFTRLDWTEIDKAKDLEGFIRIEGHATMNQAADVVQAVAKLRNKSNAFVIGNSVKVDGIADLEALPQEFEAAAAFDVMAFIKSNMTPEEWAVVEKLNAE